jgi:hypothetical protein
MILDMIGTEYRAGRLWLSSDRNRSVQWWMGQGDKTNWKVCIYSRRTAHLLWQRPFDKLTDALLFKARFDLRERIDCPSFDVDVDCYVFTVDSFTSTGTSSWSVPTGVTSITEYLVIAGGGGGGSVGGGGGAGVFTGQESPF